MLQAKELGLFETSLIPDKAGGKRVDTPLTVLTAIAQRRMGYKQGERDMSIMQHIFDVEYEEHKERITSTLLQFGDVGGYSLMSRLVGSTMAIAVKLITEGKVENRGSIIPTTPDIYEPTLEELEQLGIKMTEKVEGV